MGQMVMRSTQEKVKSSAKVILVQGRYHTPLSIVYLVYRSIYHRIRYPMLVEIPQGQIPVSLCGATA